MEAINQFIEGILELVEYKKKYESQKKDKKRMSDVLYDLMLEKYNNTSSHSQRIEEHRRDVCIACRHRDGCEVELPGDILKPIPSTEEWIPPRKTCENFEWS